MQEYSPAFREALRILDQADLPEDAEARFAALEPAIDPRERDGYEDLREALAIALGCRAGHSPRG